MLVVVEDGDVEFGPEVLLDGEALRRGDILEVDATERRGHRHHRLDDILRIRLGELKIEHVDIRKSLEEHAFALHNRF